MNLSDIIALAKQGYKPADIKELIAMADDEHQSTETDTTAAEENKTVDTIETSDDDSEAEPEARSEADDVAALATLLTNQNEKISQLSKSLAEAQKRNINTDLSGQTESTQDILDGMVRAFY